MHATAEMIRANSHAANTADGFATRTTMNLWYSNSVGMLPTEAEKRDLAQPRRRLTDEARSLLREMQDFDRF